jgi:putative autotransporter adhesin-like protein
MPNLYRAAVVAALLLLTGCSVVNGSGQTKSETRTVSGFTGIELSGIGEVTIEQGDAESLTIEADDNVLPALTSEVDGSVLRLGTKPRTRVQTRNPIHYRVTVDDLDRIDLSGSGTITGAGLKLTTLEVSISGSGTMNLAGSANQQEVEVSGSGRYEAAQLPSRSVSIEISGSGKATVAAAEQLRVDISGSGTVTYSGDPTIDQSISGSGRLVKQ